MRIDAYLKRIGFSGSVEPSFETLNALHRAHMYSVPFENLDITLGTPILLDLEMIYRKIVESGRGGFCYELNALFGWLLAELGFDVEMLSARVFGGDGNLGPDFDHMLLRVNRDFIADVGFGDSFTEPLRFEMGEQQQDTGVYRLYQEDDAWRLERDQGDGRKSQYVFTENPRELYEYEEMCRFQQTSPESIFTRKSVCSMALPDGRVTISNGRLIETADDEVKESMIADESEYRKLLRARFGIELAGRIDKLIED